ncbi:hypothetical protein GW17_00047059 [Ensete ventricosum]|nr:hypothetical protein GW17_00047059 [Ensete ventricosum]
MHYHNRKRSRLQINKRASKKRIPPPPASNPRKGNNLLPPNLTHQANPAPGGGSTATDNRHHPVIKIRRRRSRSRAARPPGSDHNAADGGRGLAGGADRSPGTSKSASGGGNYHPKWREAIAARERARVGGSVRRIYNWKPPLLSRHDFAHDRSRGPLQPAKHCLQPPHPLRLKRRHAATSTGKKRTKRVRSPFHCGNSRNGCICRSFPPDLADGRWIRFQFKETLYATAPRARFRPRGLGPHESGRTSAGVREGSPRPAPTVMRTSRKWAPRLPVFVLGSVCGCEVAVWSCRV